MMALGSKLMRLCVAWSAFAIAAVTIGCGSGSSGGGGAGGGNFDVAGLWIGTTHPEGGGTGMLIELTRDPGSKQLSGHAWFQKSSSSCDEVLADVTESPSAFAAKLPGGSLSNDACLGGTVKGSIATSDTLNVSGVTLVGPFSASLDRLTHLALEPLVADDVHQAAPPAAHEIREARYVEPGYVVVSLEGPATLDFGGDSWTVPDRGFSFLDANTLQVVASYQVSLSMGQLASPDRPIAGGSGQALVSIGSVNGATGDYTISSSAASQTLTSTNSSDMLKALVGSNGSITWVELMENDQLVWRPVQNDWVVLDATQHQVDWLDTTGAVVSTAPLPNLYNNVMTVGPDGSIAVFAQNADKLTLTRLDAAGAQLEQRDIDIGVSSLDAAVTLSDGAIVASGQLDYQIIGRMLLFRLETDDSISWKIPIDGGYDLNLSRASGQLLVRGQAMNPFTRFGKYVLDSEETRYIATVDANAGSVTGLCVLSGSSPFSAELLPSGKLLVSAGDSIGSYEPCAMPP
jgi:hypothetical protein